MKFKSYHLGIVSGLVLSFCLHHANAQSVYIDVAPANGITQQGGVGAFLGGGVSFCDFNSDGWDDLTFTSQNGDSIYFYKNLGGTFQKLNALVPLTYDVKQVLWADYDNDGDKDLFVCAYGGSTGFAPNHLYNNDGNMNLTDVTVASGIPLVNEPSFSSCWLDYNRDGYLDLYVTNRSTLLPGQQYSNHLYENNGNGTFTEVTIASNTHDFNTAPLACAALDFNNDLWPDIYIAQDKCKGGGNTLLKNLGTNTYSDISVGSGADLCIEAMCVALGDINNDGYTDIHVTNTPIGVGTPGSRMLINNTNETFTDISDTAGVNFVGFSWGSSFFDFDMDMDQDLYVSGEMTPAQGLPSSAFYENIGGLHFMENTTSGFANDTVRSYGNAIGDVDNDGFPDIAVHNRDTPFQLWKSFGGTGNYLKIQLQGVQSNRDGIGSWIEIYSAGQKQVRYTVCGQSYASQFSSSEFFGLDTISTVDSIFIKWPSGIVNRLYGVNTNQKISIIEGSTGCNSSNHMLATISKTNISCSGQNNGQVSIVVIGGSSPYNYQWNTVPEKTTSTITGLSPGFYTCSIFDNNYCYIDKTIEVREPTSLLTFYIPTNPSTTGANDGQVDLLVSGGVAPYTFIWSHGPTTEDASGLSAGTYFVTVADRNGCAILQQITLNNP